MTEKLEVRLTDPFRPESVRLIGELWRELGALYPDVQGTPFRPTDISGKRSAFVLRGWKMQGLDAEHFNR